LSFSDTIEGFTPKSPEFLAVNAWNLDAGAGLSLGAFRNFKRVIVVTETVSCEQLGVGQEVLAKRRTQRRRQWKKKAKEASPHSQL
jgi:hypothetical protein